MRDILGAEDTATQRQYEYYLTDLRTNKVIAEIPFKNVSYETVLSGPGQFSGDILINPDTLKYSIRQNTMPGQTGLYVLRDGQPVWGGIIWKRNYDTSARRVSVVGETFESYLGVRLQKSTNLFDDVDQLDIARWLLATDGVADAILATVSGATSPRERDRTFNSFEDNTVLDELTRLGDLIDGFDWNVIIGKDPQSQEITREFQFFYPHRGVSASDSTLMFEYPGAIRDFTVDENALEGANALYAVGAGEGIDRKLAYAQVDEQLDAGWPKIEQTTSHTSVILDATLQAHADADLEQLKTPITVFEITVNARVEPVLGGYNVGDWARFRMEDEFITPALDQWARITAIEVTVDDASGLEQVKITLGGEEVSSDEEEDA